MTEGCGQCEQGWIWIHEDGRRVKYPCPVCRPHGTAGPGRPSGARGAPQPTRRAGNVCSRPQVREQVVAGGVGPFRRQQLPGG
ncbi:hypothetical protein SAMN05421773_103306 [Streptomyces aidingensis]|uniref:Uncharacterized protein n=1 Tax=Streptomyces aidingensis TaxID=910347 RepID=A0A1I1JC99_9ACTN|nr:hypothetical protein SAMN05421773_103306 [Streptomyces aidingensis]